MSGLICIFILALSVTACASLPKDIAKSPSYTIQCRDNTKLGRITAGKQEQHPGESGFYILPVGMDDFVARAILIDAAERTLDLQYYIVNPGLTVDILMERLIRAAKRGVRVRLLFDDLGVGLTDEQLWLLDHHPNIEIRLFNPVPERRRGLITFFSLLGNFRQINHRMHNKAFIVDNTAAIVGGRNLADEYFGAGEDSNFADMGILGMGPVANEIAKSFDLYWNSDWSVPFAYFLDSQPDKEDFETALRELEDKNSKARDSNYVRGLRDSVFLQQLMSGNISLSWAKSQVLYDLPEKVSEDGEKKDASVYLGTHLYPIASKTRSDVTLVSPYFIPGKEGLEMFRKIRDQGIRVRILTNSLASTDVPSVHSGYMNYRKDLLDAGVEIYEMRPDESGEKEKHVRRKFLGSSRGSLHAKIYIFDRETVFIGSRNLDPRSNRVNTEVGVVAESPEIARQVATVIDRGMSPTYSFRVTLSGSGRVIWTTEEDGKEVVYRKEPLTGFWRRLSVRFMSVFVPESLL
jgi:putative cardiolipin synthase